MPRIPPPTRETVNEWCKAAFEKHVDVPTKRPPHLRAVDTTSITIGVISYATQDHVDHCLKRIGDTLKEVNGFGAEMFVECVRLDMTFVDIYVYYFAPVEKVVGPYAHPLAGWSGALPAMTTPDVCGAFQRHFIGPSYIAGIEHMIDDGYHRRSNAITLPALVDAATVDSLFETVANEMHEQGGIVPKMELQWLDSGWWINITWRVLTQPDA